jgi:hypothetical protein
MNFSVFKYYYNKYYYYKNGDRRKVGIWWWVLRGDLMWFKDPAVAFIELGMCFVVEKTERLHACKKPFA